MTTSSNTLWLLVVVGMLAIVAARLSRSLGAFGLILTVFLVVVLLRLARDLLQARFARRGEEGQPAATRNVTPWEGWLPPGNAPSASATATPQVRDPAVVVVQPPDGTAQLEAKLAALDRLRATGHVTEEEYEAKRAQLIADF